MLGYASHIVYTTPLPIIGSMNNAAIYLLALLMMIISSCSLDMSESEVYQILNQVIADNKLQVNRVCQDFKSLHLKNEYKEVFSQDLEFIKNQKEQFSDLKVKPNKLKYYNERTGNYDFIEVDTTCSEGFIYHISLPIVSEDRQKVLIEFNQDCNCLLGGQGGKELYVRRNGRWEKEKSFDRWISLEGAL
ncbi:hypothetical protein ACFSKU_14720 [Pontibacter silvestris]|uniref:DUF3347 domain-containing protein n=1 Tax=Pontibacter silvestris TaxID=2305183 RepID=A0ABW4X0B0_9BACT|nr:hypothetical protein [Pontibacter silvestris]MCC9138966.1 hypothetical protein [Pontibacter silvestris]